MSQIGREKRHAACDECRVRKMKCSGEYPVCQRCQMENILCIYSPRKKMGRPRKRRREGDDLEDLGLDAFEPFPVSPGLDLSGPDLLYDFDGSHPSHSSFLNPPDLSFGTQFDPGLNHLDSFPDQPLNHSTNDQEPISINPNNQETSDAIQLESETHTNSQDNENNNQTSNQCTCLHEMSQTISTLRVLTPHSFPTTLPPLRTALKTTLSLLNCPHCPQQSTTAMQNILFLTTLLTSITSAYHSLLTSIDSEASLALRTGEKKQFRFGDSDPSKAYLHTGTVDCPMGFDTALSGSEWKMLARKVVEGDILVPASSPVDSAVGTHQLPQNDITVLGLANQLEERQLRWHESHVHEHFAGTSEERCVPKEGEEFHCLRIVKMIRSHVDMLNLGESEKLGRI